MSSRCRYSTSPGNVCSPLQNRPSFPPLNYYLSSIIKCEIEQIVVSPLRSFFTVFPWLVRIFQYSKLLSLVPHLRYFFSLFRLLQCFRSGPWSLLSPLDPAGSPLPITSSAVGPVEPAICTPYCTYRALKYYIIHYLHVPTR